MKLMRIVSIVVATLAVALAGCQTDGTGGSGSSDWLQQRQQRRLLTARALDGRVAGQRTMNSPPLPPGVSEGDFRLALAEFTAIAGRERGTRRRRRRKPTWTRSPPAMPARTGASAVVMPSGRRADPRASWVSRTGIACRCGPYRPGATSPTAARRRASPAASCSTCSA